MPAKGVGKGTRVMQTGYVQIIRRGPDYGKLEHRVVMREMCREWCYYPLNGDGLPEGMDVHHADFSKAHNCRANLVLMDPVLHIHMDRSPRADKQRYVNGRYGRTPAPPDGAVVVWEEFVCRDCGMVRKVAVSWCYPDEIPDWVTEETVGDLGVVRDYVEEEDVA